MQSQHGLPSTRGTLDKDTRVSIQSFKSDLLVFCKFIELLGGEIHLGAYRSDEPEVWEENPEQILIAGRRKRSGTVGPSVIGALNAALKAFEITLRDDDGLIGIGRQRAGILVMRENHGIAIDQIPGLTALT